MTWRVGHFGGGVATECVLCGIFGGDNPALQAERRAGPVERPTRRCGWGLLRKGQLVVSAVSSTTNEVWRDESSAPLNEIVTVCPAKDERLNDFWL